MPVDGLSESDINNMLREVKIFRGTYPSNLLPLRSKGKTQAFVINTDRDHLPGSHWVGLILSGGKCRYFDSFGRENLNLDILTALKTVGIKSYIYNSRQIQPAVSNKCGFYCIAFVLSFIHGMSYHSFLKLFSNDLEKNDEICLQFINKFICNT